LCRRQRTGGRCRFGFERFRFARERCKRLARIRIERPFAREILFGLRDALALTLRGFAGARFFLIERFAFKRQTMKRRTTFGFGMTERFELVRSFEPRG
jgi:hypothetical protein